MKQRPDGFLGPEFQEANPEQFDYIVELHEYLWRFVRAVSPGAGGYLHDVIGPAIKEAERRRDERTAMEGEPIADYPVSDADPVNVIKNLRYRLDHHHKVLARMYARLFELQGKAMSCAKDWTAPKSEEPIKVSHGILDVAGKKDEELSFDCDEEHLELKLSIEAGNDWEIALRAKEYDGIVVLRGIAVSIAMVSRCYDTAISNKYWVSVDGCQIKGELVDKDIFLVNAQDGWQFIQSLLKTGMWEVKWHDGKRVKTLRSIFDKIYTLGADPAFDSVHKVRCQSLKNARLAEPVERGIVAKIEQDGNGVRRICLDDIITISTVKPVRMDTMLVPLASYGKIRIQGEEVFLSLIDGNSQYHLSPKAFDFIKALHAKGNWRIDWINPKAVTYD